MRKLLSIIILMLLWARVDAFGCEIGPVVVGGVRASNLIDVGSDEKLSVNGCALFSIKSGAVQKPENIVDAENIIIEGMPHWMYRAVRESRGDYDCSVQVNGMDYLYLLVLYYMQRWSNDGLKIDHLLAGDEPLGDPVIRLQEHVCKKIKLGMNAKP